MREPIQDIRKDTIFTTLFCDYYNLQQPNQVQKFIRVKDSRFDLRHVSTTKEFLVSKQTIVTHETSVHNLMGPVI